VGENLRLSGMDRRVGHATCALLWRFVRKKGIRVVGGIYIFLLLLMSPRTAKVDSRDPHRPGTSTKQTCHVEVKHIRINISKHGPKGSTIPASSDLEAVL